MKNIITLIFLATLTCAQAQVIIGDAIGTATVKTSVLLEFAAGKNKGIIVPYVRTLPAASASNQGTILLDASNAATARMKFSNGSAWIDLSGQDANVSTALATQPTATQNPELSTSKAIISDQAVTNSDALPDGVLILESTTKAMVLPTVGMILQDSVLKVNVPNPSPGMMVYVNTTGAKRLAVYNGSKWSFWRP